MKTRARPRQARKGFELLAKARASCVCAPCSAVAGELARFHGHGHGHCSRIANCSLAGGGTRALRAGSQKRLDFLWRSVMSCIAFAPAIHAFTVAKRTGRHELLAAAGSCCQTGARGGALVEITACIAGAGAKAPFFCCNFLLMFSRVVLGFPLSATASRLFGKQISCLPLHHLSRSYVPCF